MPNLKTRLEALEAARTPTDETTRRARLIVAILANGYRRANRQDLPDDKRRAWLANLCTAEGMNRFHREWMEARHEQP
jgi:hypothetical protein